MKQYIRIFLLLLISISALSASADGNEKYFDGLSTKTGFDYSYVSPTMLRMVGDSYFDSNSKNFKNLPIKTKDIKSIENVSTIFNGNSEELWNTIRKVKKLKKMETLTTDVKDNYRYDVLVTLSKTEKYILNLMVITQNGSQNVDVIYIEGKIPVDGLKNSFR